jgi:hypothetical protein
MSLTLFSSFTAKSCVSISSCMIDAGTAGEIVSAVCSCSLSILACCSSAPGKTGNCSSANKDNCSMLFDGVKVGSVAERRPCVAGKEILSARLGSGRFSSPGKSVYVPSWNADKL